jgi:tight adherence protein B
MLLTFVPLPGLRALAIVMLSVAPPLWLASQSARVSSALTTYAEGLTRDLSYLRLRVQCGQVIAGQLALFIAALALVLTRSYLAASLVGTAVFAPRPWLNLRRSRRTTAIEDQLDGWLFGLASTMRATPAPGQAIEYSSVLVAAPLRDELETLLKEQKLGTSLDQALARMAQRIGSRTVQSALGTLRIGQASGGDIPQILERSAATLREMARLEGVVRTKTAESKAQAWLLALLPFPLIALLNWLDPGFLAPLSESARGFAVIVAAVLLWLSSIFVARRILDVDI